MLALRDLTKRFVSTTGEVVSAVDRLRMEVASGETLALLGPSGCGKTTTLRLIAGLASPDAGAVVIEGEDVTRRPPHRRGVGMVFQQPALLPHLRVRDNILFGRRASAPETIERLADIAERLGVSTFLERHPGELSGGEQQRVALARALLGAPSLLLLDEPLGSLDLPARTALRDELLRVRLERKRTLIHVTHDQAEAFALADRVAVMRQGRVEQCDTPARLYSTPASRFVAEFLGPVPMRFLRARLDGDGLRLAGAARPVPVPASWSRSLSADGGVDLELGIRAGAVTLLENPLDAPTADEQGLRLPASFVCETSTGDGVLVDWDCLGQRLQSTSRGGQAEQQLGIAWHQMHLFDAASGHRCEPSRI